MSAWSGTCGPTPAQTTRPSSRPALCCLTASIAAARPSAVARSAMTSASRRSMPMTRCPSRGSPARIAAPMPDADPETAITPIAGSRPELVDGEQIPHELPYLHHLATLDAHAQARRVVERLVVAFGVTAKQRDGMLVVG